MKRFVFLLFFITLGILNADTTLTVKTVCLFDKKEFMVNISSSKLDLTDDALQDNLGGYVDIPATKYYIKTKKVLYHLDGVVQRDYKIGKNLFSATIKKVDDKLITLEQLYSLKNDKKIKFIQKIDLEKNNTSNTSKNITTTNILYISFDESLFEKEYQRCK